MQLPPNTSISKLTKISTRLEDEVYKCDIGSHHYKKPVFFVMF
jgi:hypothetical protein